MRRFPWTEKHGAKVIGAVIVIAGIAIIWASAQLCVWAPSWPYGISDLGGKLGEAVIIAGVIALAVDSYLKKELLREASRGLFEHIIGFDHEPELRARIKSIAFDTKLYRRDLRLDCDVRPSASGGVLIEMCSRQEIINQSLHSEPYAPTWTFDECENPGNLEFTATFGDGQPVKTRAEFQKVDAHHMTGKSGPFEIKPRAQQIRYRFSSRCTMEAPANYFHTIYMGIPTIDVTVSVSAPEGWKVWVDERNQAINNSDEWHTSGLLMTGDHVEIHWRSPNNQSVVEKTMSNLPIAVGDFPAQQRFIQRNSGFLREYPFLRDLYEKVFLRSLQPVDESAREPLLQLPETDPAVVAFEDKAMADLVVFYLGRIAADDFGELLTLSGNGRGFGAYKILRGMYERVVTAMYVAKHPSEARVFVESSAVTKRNYLTRAKAVPEMKDRVRDEVMQKVEENAAEVSAKRKQSVCSKCHQPVTQEAWTRVSMDVMAKEVDPFLGLHYHEFYVETTAQIHPNMFGVERRLVVEGGGYTYKEISEDEARLALYLGHNLMIRLLNMQNEYFKLGVDAELQERAMAFGKAWGSDAPEPSDEVVKSSPDG